jgi:hypothetical protein
LCPPEAPAHFSAQSHRRGGYTPITRAPFTTSDPRFSDVYAAPSEWLYYPREFGLAMLAQGVHTVIECHSGLTMVDGEYDDPAALARVMEREGA